MNNNQWQIFQQQQRNHMMGAAWEQKQKKKREEELEEFNRGQQETQREATRAQSHQQNNQPFENTAWGQAEPPGTAQPAQAVYQGKKIETSIAGFVKMALVVIGTFAALFGAVCLLVGSDAFLAGAVVAFFSLGWAYSLQKKYFADGSQPKVKKSGKNLTGEARSVEWRMESGGNVNIKVFSFRVQRYDNLGNPMEPIPVQMRGVVFTGTIQEGDKVCIPGEWKVGHLLQPKKIDNLTTKSVFKPGRKISKTERVLDIVYLAFWFVIIPLIIYYFLIAS
jgi:hypothetical protein